MATEIIDALGGSREVAKALGIAPNVVANWRTRDIPWKRRHAIAQMAEARGIAVPASFLGAA